MQVPILLPKVFNHPFTYIHNSKNIKNLSQGDIVIVPFGKNKEIGVVWDKIKKTNKKIKLKHIEKKVSGVRLNKKLIKFINWFAIYNLAPKGLILKMCLGNLKNFEKVQNNKEKNEAFSKIINYNLNAEQQKALDNLLNLGNKFSVAVLLGITGSGKTLIYFERIKQLIKQNKQALILIPEIFLTTQFKNRFKLFFGYGYGDINLNTNFGVDHFESFFITTLAGTGAIGISSVLLFYVFGILNHSGDTKLAEITRIALFVCMAANSFSGNVFFTDFLIPIVFLFSAVHYKTKSEHV